MTHIRQLRLRGELVRVRKRLLTLPCATTSLPQRLRLIQQAARLLTELKAGTVHTIDEERQ